MSKTTHSEENILTSAISKKISRRSFIKWSAALGATASASGLIAQTGLQVAGATPGSWAPNSVQGGTWIGTTCLVCHSWCQKAVLVNGGIIKKIEGIGGQPRSGCVALTNATDANYISAGPSGFLPYSLHNRGRICAKGNDGVEHAYDPERVKYPLKRVGDRGSGKWARITWDQAYMEISTVMREMAGLSTDANGAAIAGARGKDLRHRFVNYVGRNETQKGGGQGGLATYHGFTKAYGSPNHVEHTSLCELSRHVAHWLTFGDKFPLPDLQSHAGSIAGTASGGLHDGPASDYDVDFFASVGGNWAEATIPHTSFASRVTDMRRRGTRIVGIDVRQSNSLACSDEQLFIVPGTDAALALGIIHQMLSTAGCTGNKTVTAGKVRLDAGHLNNKYVGIFSCQEDTGSDSDGVTPDGKSLESYVFGTNGAAGPVKNAAWAAPICGLLAADITYLGEAMGGESADGTIYNSPVYDGYRGAAKHTNGTYSFRVLRSMQVLAGINNASAKYRGGIDRPGGIMMDAWGGDAGGWQNTGDPAAAPAGGANAGCGDTSSLNAGLPTDYAKAGDGKQALWSWDYDQGLPKFKWAKARVDQNLVPGIRASIGLHPYKAGFFREAGHKVPYDTYDNGLGAGDYKVEAMLLFKNSPGLSRANIDLDVECFTAKDGSNNYRLAHMWAIDIHMGAASRYADIVLPDTTYLERYDYKDSWENFALKRHVQLRQPVIANLYNSKQVRQIIWELARYVEDPAGANNGAEAPFNGSLTGNVSAPKKGQYNWDGAAYAGVGNPGATLGKGSIAVDSATPLSLKAVEALFVDVCSDASIPGATRDDRFDFMRAHSVYWTTATYPNYFPHGSKDGSTSYTGGLKSSSGTGAARIEIYHKDLAASTDPTLGNLLGTPVYVPLTQSTSAGLPLHLTTYKLNVHTQSRTAACPRLMEIIGHNWAVISPATAASPDPSDPGNPLKVIANGDKVRVTTAEGSLELEAKVTKKAQAGCVHISHSIGDEYVPNGANAHGSSKGRYEVIGVGDNRQDALTAAGGPGATVYDAYALALAASAPIPPDSNGAHPNHAIQRTADGTWTNPGGAPIALSIGTSAGLVTDPVGGSLGWFDSKCKIEKIV